jgi:RNA polymerase sigma-70 factor, ECF subfamily
MDQISVRQLRNGNQEARTEFYKKYRVRLYHYCYQLLGNRSDAEDTVHETFMKIFNGIDGLHSSGAFRSWIYSIARNESLQVLRKKRPLVVLDHEETTDRESLEQQIDSNDLAMCIRAEIETLKPEYREVIFLREYHHLTYDEIAGVLQITKSSVKNMLFRARKQLCDRLKPYYDERRKYEL